MKPSALGVEHRIADPANMGEGAAGRACATLGSVSLVKLAARVDGVAAGGGTKTGAVGIGARQKAAPKAMMNSMAESQRGKVLGNWIILGRPCNGQRPQGPVSRWGASVARKQGAGLG